MFHRRVSEEQSSVSEQCIKVIDCVTMRHLYGIETRVTNSYTLIVITYHFSACILCVIAAVENWSMLTLAECCDG